LLTKDTIVTLPFEDHNDKDICPFTIIYKNHSTGRVPLLAQHFS
jgi:hypothetical protein